MTRLPSPTAASTRPKLRCAIYTRVSSDSGLEQEFNSLDNQREAAEAYVKSQAHEGWSLLPTRYDDGGFSGGTMERPALKALLDAIRARAIDVVVVYKVDRLTRSLADFAKLVECFDEHGVSFVSVTQSFNTTTSMGRLTLNVLLSFAQFEREVTGERIRDKIAASKRKGLWMGGTVPYGYRVEARKLVVVPNEAEQVRALYQRYLELKSVPALVQELGRQGFRTRLRPLASGRMIGGVALTHGPLSVILKNRMYLGELKHKGMTYKAEHEPIVTPEVFEAVQQALAANRKGDQDKWSASGALLLGRIYDDRGHRMTPAHANKGPIRYRYYVSRARTQGRTGEPGTIERVPAPAIEAAILTALQAHEQAAARAVRGGEYRLDLTNAPAAPYTEHVISQPASTVDDAAALIDRLLERVTVGERTIVIALQPEKEGAEPTTLTLPWKRPRHARQRAVRGPAGDSPARPTIRAEARARLVAAIARARGWVEDLVEGRVTSTEQIATREGVSGRSVCMALPLALLPPAVVQSAVAGSLPAGLGITTLANLSPNWKAEDFARDQSTSA